MSEHTQKQPHEMPDEELNIAVAKAAGYWVYHYDKDYEANCYYMLCLPNTVDSAVIDDFRASENQAGTQGNARLRNWHGRMPLTSRPTSTRYGCCSKSTAFCISGIISLKD